ncbi:MAG TPA: response regulator transcription factor [Gaiellaceae bacterium]|nr:response regulator transcription factor [Gaiellaceae bacterium]
MQDAEAHPLERGRQSFASRAWTDAYESLVEADQNADLGAGDLELLATAAFMLGRDDAYASTLERAHHAYLREGAPRRAVRCAFWLGVSFALRGEMGPATGWLGRAQRLVEHEQDDCVEQGYLLLAGVFRHAAAGDWDAGYATAADAAAVGERFGEPDLIALALFEQGRALIKRERAERGLALLDEAMVSVTAGELSPTVTGFVYCAVIAACQEAYAMRRAQEWTAALTHWCEQQPDMLAFTGRCLVHRAELMQLQGSWHDALEEARRACERLAREVNQLWTAHAFYQQAEIHRLRGEFTAAEKAYREASRCGSEPQPGLALLRLAEGNHDAAAAAIRRAVGETSERPRRARLLPACVEILLAAGDAEEARSACRELEAIAAEYGSSMLSAIAAHARGAVELAEGNARASLVPSRQAWQRWHDLEVPYEAARARVLIGLACRALGDDDTAELEFDSARRTFGELGAAPDLQRLDAVVPRSAADTSGLTPRELEVLRRVAAGETNKAIASALVLSERTVERHVSNIFVKLRVSSRAAATAFAYEHHLV